MPRDYAKNSKRKERAQLPGWVWMLGGLVIGLFVAFLVYLNNNTSQQQKELFTETFNKEVEQVKQAQQKTAPEDTQASRTDSEKKAQKPRFDFYTILPELEVAIPDQELARVEESDEAPALEPGTEYILQAGSFRDAREADRLKARLALQGIEAEIQTVQINQGDTWHRVRVGPMQDIATVNRTRRRLQEIGIPAIVVKSKG